VSDKSPAFFSIVMKSDLRISIGRPLKQGIKRIVRGLNHLATGQATPCGNKTSGQTGKTLCFRDPIIRSMTLVRAFTATPQAVGARSRQRVKR
jgi:hypothetical protein